MIILGLTGSIAMGKSTIAKMFCDEGVAVHDADAAVHELMTPEGAAYGSITAAFDGITKADGHIDRQALGRLVFGDAARRTLLEDILHPLVRQIRGDWLARRRAEGAEVAVLDVPLLFETGVDAECDRVAVVSASPRQQAARALARPGMTEDKLTAILAVQMPHAEKCRRADYVIPTHYGEDASRWHVRRLIKTLQRQTPHA